uniref:Uncharacterized protein n=1 Tax=Picea sitchensis TaxID=3332 RepID=D5A953_PICSI|nr:unknown [Picea sitchensis]
MLFAEKQGWDQVLLSARIVAKVMQINQRYLELSLSREERFTLRLEVLQM